MIRLRETLLARDRTEPLLLPGGQLNAAKALPPPGPAPQRVDPYLEILLLRVLEDPGCSTRQALLKTGVPRQRFHQSLKTLMDSGHLVSVGDQNAQFLFPAWPGVEDCLPQLLALQNKHRRRICLFLACNGPLPRSEVLNHSQKTLNLSPRSTETHLAILAQVGLVQGKAETQADRRHVYLAAADLSLPVQMLMESHETRATLNG